MIRLTRLGFSADEADLSRAVDAVFPDQAAYQKETAPASDPLRDELRAMAEMLKSLDDRIRLLEARLGPSPRQPSLTTSFERRMADSERRLDRIEQQSGQLRQMEQRLRRLEIQN